MRRYLSTAFLFAFLAPALATEPPHISEKTIREIAQREYTLILAAAAKWGRLYSRDETASGAKRHFVKLRDTYLSLGYVVTPEPGT